MSMRSLFALLFLFASALPSFGDKPDDSRSSQSRADETESMSDVPKEIGGKTLEQWKRDLSHPDASVRTEAIRALPGFRKAAAPVVPDLVKVLLNDGDASPRVKAAMALNMMYIRPTDETSVIEGLGKCIGSDPQAIIRYEAVNTLKRFGKLDTPAKRKAISGLVANITQAHGGSTYELRDICIEELINAGPDPKHGPETSVTSALLYRAVFETTTQVRLRAITALGALGRPQDPQMLTQVVNMLKDQRNWNSTHKSIRIWSHVALMSLEEKVNEKYLQTIADYLTDRERDTRIHAVAAFGALEEKSHDYVDRVCNMMRKEKEVIVLQAGCIALGQMGDQGERVMNTLIALTEVDERDRIPVVMNACIALEKIGVANKEVMDAMNKVLEHKSLETYQKDIVRKLIKDIQTPKTAKKKKDDKRELEAKPARDLKKR